MTIRFGMRALAMAALAAALTACASYPAEPRYSTRAEAAPPPLRTPAYPTTPAPSGEGVRGPTNPSNEAPPPRTAPVGSIEGGALDAPVYAGPRPAAGPASEGFTAPPPPARGTGAVTAGAAYEIQPGDTISGIGRRFQTPVQTLIDLNGLGPRAAISPGQRIILPDSAVDIGGDPYATGPSPGGVYVPEAGTPPPPPPPPPSGNAATPPPAAGGAASSVSLDWPVRGDILR
ncbi:MAG: LysM peptidoglycan-binding domain-containing protein, partial [Brevundimonas sp.]